MGASGGVGGSTMFEPKQEPKHLYILESFGVQADRSIIMNIYKGILGNKKSELLVMFLRIV